MNNTKLSSFEEDGTLLPFSFKRKKIPEQKVKAHWIKVLHEIEPTETKNEFDTESDLPQPKF